tara:strand:+ start:24 stop:338 length:315 start_codon:yes stop_codon:yes gene_type:complete
MKREIKFRAWNTNSKEMMDCISIQDLACRTKLDRANVNLLIFEQFTGLKDKNGVDIYEGDELDNEQTVKYSIEQGCYFAGEIPLCMSNSHRKVVGNIHENINTL